MYKRLSLAQLTDLNTKFVAHLKQILKSDKCTTFHERLKVGWNSGYKVTFWDGSDPLMRIEKLPDQGLLIVDEKEKIEVLLTADQIPKLNTMTKSDTSLSKGGNTSILERVLSDYMDQQRRTIAWKPYLVYDIETLMIQSKDLIGLDFELWYSICSRDHETTMDKNFKYIATDNLKKFVDFLLEFDGWIIGFNNLAFDNIVIGLNEHLTSEQIQSLHNKTLDIFMYIWNLTNKRISLNKVAVGLIGLSKTLEGWGVAGDPLLRDYKTTGNLQALKQVKDYCKGDVKMTLGVLLYMMKYQTFFIEGVEYNWSESDFVTLANNDRNKKVEAPVLAAPNRGLFG